jgi:hypothetical protein
MLDIGRYGEDLRRAQRSCVGRDSVSGCERSAVGRAGRARLQAGRIIRRTTPFYLQARRKAINEYLVARPCYAHRVECPGNDASFSIKVRRWAVCARMISFSALFARRFETFRSMYRSDRSTVASSASAEVASAACEGSRCTSKHAAEGGHVTTNLSCLHTSLQARV